MFPEPTVVPGCEIGYGHKLHSQGRFNDRGTLEFRQAPRIDVHVVNIILAKRCVKSESGIAHKRLEKKQFQRLSRFRLVKHTMQEHDPPSLDRGRPAFDSLSAGLPDPACFCVIFCVFAALREI